MKARDITQSGILIALTLIILYSTSLIPISTLSVLTLASCLVPIAIMRSSIKNGFLVYIASTLIGFLFIPINIIIFYGLFFGIYGIIKFYIEKINKLPLEIALKLIFFNLIFFIIFLLLNNFIKINFTVIPLWIICLLAQPVFLIFDYALTLIISVYLEKIHRRI
ncbi:hypothetical protein JCM1393_03270 [Clostridium carnis]